MRRLRPGVVALSSDGHRLVLDRGGGHNADLVDLGTRNVLSSFSYVAGEPRFGFSADGKWVFVAGPLAGASLTAWEIHSPIPDRIVEGSPAMSFFFSRDATRILVLHYAAAASRFELYDGQGTRLLSGSLGQQGNVNLADDGNRIVTRDDGGVRVLNAADGKVIWNIDCKDCRRVALSADGSRVLTSSGKLIAVWEVGSLNPIWTEAARVGPLTGALRLSPDGRRVAWGKGLSAYVHTIGESTEFEARVEDSLWDARFSYDGQRLVIASPGEIAAWSVGSWKPQWRVPSFASGFVELRSSADDSVVLAGYDALGTMLLDAATGQHLATIPTSKPRAFYPADLVLPTLRGKISRGGGRWELWSLPGPDAQPPAQRSLARVLAEAGLEMRGVELVDAPPAPSPGADLPRR